MGGRAAKHMHPAPRSLLPGLSLLSLPCFSSFPPLREGVPAFQLLFSRQDRGARSAALFTRQSTEPLARTGAHSLAQLHELPRRIQNSRRAISHQALYVTDCHFMGN